MACTNITTGGSVSLTAGSLGTFCHTDWQSTYNSFIANTSVAFSGGAIFTANSTEPSNNGHLWLKQDENDNCAPLGWYYHNGTNWSSPVPICVGLASDWRFSLYYVKGISPPNVAKKPKFFTAKKH